MRLKRRSFLVFVGKVLLFSTLVNDRYGESSIVADATSSNVGRKLQSEEETRTILKDLYDATNGPNWKNEMQLNWNTEAFIETWYGITTYSRADEKLYSISLSNGNLEGTLPNSLFDFISLGKLNISDNLGLTGGISENIGKLHHIEELDLSSCSFTGTIPSTFMQNVSSEFYSTITVDLSNNKITGTIPVEFTRFEKMNLLLGGNEISGIPPEICEKYQWMDGLVAKYGCDAILCPPGAFNYPTGKAEISGDEGFGIRPPLPDYSNKPELLDPGPCKINCFSALTYGNTFCEQDVREIREILEEFYFATNGPAWKKNEKWLSNAPIEEWYGITKGPLQGMLERNEWNGQYSLFLERNNLAGSIPESFYEFRSLQQLSFTSNSRLKGTISDRIGLLRNLDYLDFSLCDFSGTLPEAIYNLERLSFLFFGFNFDLTGTVSESIGNLKNLEQLALTMCNFYGTLPSGLFNLEYLIALELSWNRGLTGTLSKELMNMPSLLYLDLSHCNFLALSPDIFSSEIKMIFFVDFSNNTRLTGPFPDFDGASFPILGTMDISHCSFTGTLPSGLHDLELLHHFDASYNQFSGPLPSFSNFYFDDILETFLNLQNNNFYGNIPHSFLENATVLNSFFTINLRENKLTGTIPSNLSRFENAIIELDGNKISGIPAEICEKTGWMEGRVGKHGCDAILCPPGTKSAALEFQMIDNAPKKPHPGSGGISSIHPGKRSLLGKYTSPNNCNDTELCTCCKGPPVPIYGRIVCFSDSTSNSVAAATIFAMVSFFVLIL